MSEKNIAVKFATGRNLEQVKAFFAASATGDDSAFSDASELKHADRVWKVVAEWDASHSVPKRGDRQRINDPTLVEWSPNGEQLVTACDAFGITRWYADGRRIGGGTPSYAYGHPIRFFWHPDGDLVLLEAQTGLNTWWTIQNRGGGTIAHVTANGLYWGTDTMNSSGFHRTRCFNPWRPGARQLLIGRYEGPCLDLIDISAFPEPSTTNLPTFLAQAVGLIRHWARQASGVPDKEALESAPVINSVSFAPLGAQDRQIMRFAWHPSGKYVAVTTGHPDDKSMRRVHILDIDIGEIVASIPPTTSAVGWSPGGRLLFCQQWSNAYTSNWKIDTVVWDSHAWALRELSEEERRQPWARHFESSRLGVGDNALNANGTLSANLDMHSSSGVTIGSNNGDKDKAEAMLLVEGKVPYLAWSPTDPQCLATVGGTDASHSLRIWQLRKI